MSAPRPPTKLTVLISGSGTNLQALIDASSTAPNESPAAKSPTLPNTQIIRVISNKKTAFGLQRAERAGIPTRYHNLIGGKYMKSGEKDEGVVREARQKYDADLARLVLEDEPDLVVCAGWMHILAPSFLDPLAAAGVPIINLHPALPGRYDGAHAIERAYNDFQAGKLENGRTGVMIHYVISEVDRGEPILVKEIECQQGESLEALEERIHRVEHVAIVEGAGLAIEKLWKAREAEEKR
jgi:phosphoribosylglycinamide formyltransferase